MAEQAQEGCRLSPRQRRLWSLQRDGDGLAYRAQAAVRLSGPIAVERLRRALERLVQQHEIFGLVFQSLPGLRYPLQVVASGGYAWTGEEDLRPLDPRLQEERIAAFFSPRSWEPFDLTAGPLLRAGLLRTGPEESVLLLSLPSLLGDAAGLRNLVRELGRCHASLEPGGAEPSPSLQYLDLAEWENALLEGEDGAAGRAFWQGRDAFSSVPRLPFLPPSPGPFLPETVALELPDSLAAGLRELSARLGVRPASLAQACWALLLARRSGRDRVALGFVFDGRRYAELSGAVGPFARCLPVVVEADPARGLGELAAGLEAARQEAHGWQELYSWDDETSGGEALYLPFCVEEGEFWTQSFSPGISASLLRVSDHGDRFDLKLGCVRDGERLRLELTFDPLGIRRDDLDRLAEGLLALLAAAGTEGPSGRLPVIGGEERRRLLDLGRAHRPAAQDGTVAAAFAAQAGRTPSRVAVRCEEREITYGELAARASRLAGRLQALGVGPGRLVPLLVETSDRAVEAMLGVLWAGGAYVPLAPQSPPARIAAMLDDLGAPWALSEPGLAHLLPPAGPAPLLLGADREEGPGVPPAASLPEDPVYALFTSGSTGRPKAVVVENRQLLGYVDGVREALDLSPEMTFALVSTVAADLGNTMIFPALLGGGCLLVVDAERAVDAGALAEVLRRHPADCMKVVPSHLEALLASRDESGVLPRRKLVLGGEAASWELVARVRELAPGCAVYNHYGPTETTVGIVAGLIPGGPRSAAEPVPLGRPLAGAEVFLLDAEGLPAPLGGVGELYAGGPGVARGYLHRPDLTAGRFVPHPFALSPGERLYRTGDLARWRDDGRLEFLGRADDQVKIRGFRVELQEIERIAEEHPGVARTVVVARTGPQGPRLLAALLPERETAGGALAALRLARAPLPDGASLLTLPDGLTLCQINRRETEYVHREIFTERSYLRHGVSVAAGDCVFDVGANIGLFSLFAARECPGVTVFAFEPIPPVCEALRINAAAHGVDARVFPCGLAETEGRQAFTYYPHLTLMSSRYADLAEERAVVRSFLRQGPDATWSREMEGGLLEELLDDRLSARSFECPLRTLSAILREQRVERIDLLKLDVQKSELDVLAGIADEDWGRIRQIVAEVHDLEGRLRKILDLLRDRGFETVVEQGSSLGGTPLFQLYAVRPDARRPAEPSAKRPAKVWNAPAELLASVRDHLRKHLPEVMVPADCVLLEALPLTPNGKVDRMALASLAGEPEASETPAAVAPRTPLEEVVAGLWTDLLERPVQDTTRSFFELGGHSLLATRLISLLRQSVGVEVPLRVFLENPTVSALASRVEERLRGEGMPAPPPVVPVPRDRPLPLSSSQQRLWFLHQLDPDLPTYNVPVALRLSGRLDAGALAATLGEIVRRHEVLRTTFDLADGMPVQRIGPPGPVPLPLADLCGLPPGAREAEVGRLAREEARRAFDLRLGPLMRVSLLRLAESEHVMLMTLHHIVTDGWSNGILAREIASLYEDLLAGCRPTLPPLPVQYADFAVWQEGWLGGGTLERQFAYWRERLGGEIPVLALPTDRPRPALKSWRGAKERIVLPPEVNEALQALARREGATLFMVLLAGFYVLLYRYSGQEDLIVGCGTAGRDRGETERLIGYFVNTLALRVRLDGNPEFRELVGRVREATLGAYAHQEVPFEKIVEELQPQRRKDHAPLFRVMFSLQNVPAETFQLTDLDLSWLDVHNDTAKFDLILTLNNLGDELAGSIEYDLDLFRRESVTRLLGHYSRILADAALSPETRVLDIPLTARDSGTSGRTSVPDADQFDFDWEEVTHDRLSADRIQ